MQDLLLDISSDSRASKAASNSATLMVSGHLPRPRSYSLGELRRLPRHEIGPTRVDCFTGRPVCEMQNCAGARLIDLLDEAGFSSAPRSELKRCVVIAGSLDGYQAIFSWNELYNAAAGCRVLVLYELEGRPIRGHLGALCLIAAGDRQLGPRHLRQLVSVQARLV